MTLFALFQVQLRLQLTSDAAEERPGRTVASRDFCTSDAAEERPGRTVASRDFCSSDAAEERPGRTVASRDFCSSDAAEERPGRTVASRLTVISAVRSLDQLRLANLSPHWPSVQTARVEHDSAMAVYMVLACCDKKILKCTNVLNCFFNVGSLLSKLFLL